MDDAAQREALHQIIDQIVVGPVDLCLQLKPMMQPGIEADDDQAPDYEGATIVLPSPAAGKAHDLHTIIDGPASSGSFKPAKWMVKAIARGFTWYDEVISGRAATMREIAEREDVSERYVAQLIRMAFIDPKRVEAYIDGSKPIHLASAEVASGIGIPMSWQSQAKAF